MELFSLVVMGNGKQVLPVLQCLKRGIAFVSSSLHMFLISAYNCSSLYLKIIH